MNSGSPYLWSLYDKGVCAVDTEAGDPGIIKCLDFSSKLTKTLFSLPKSTPINQGGPSFSISRDGMWILYVSVDRRESDIMIAEKFR